MERYLEYMKRQGQILKKNRIVSICTDDVILSLSLSTRKTNILMDDIIHHIDDIYISLSMLI